MRPARDMVIGTGMGTGTDMGEVIIMVGDSGLYRLMTWLSPNFPVGAFAWSHGLETAVDQGRVNDRESLITMVGGIVDFGAGRVDVAFFRQAWEAASNDQPAGLLATTISAQAQRGSAEMALESTAQGRAFLDTLSTVWPHPLLDRWRRDLAAESLDPAYPVVAGVAAALAGVPLRPALVAYLNAFAANLVSAAVRLVPLGQTDGQRALAALEAPILAAAEHCLLRPADDFGQAALSVDWLSMQHETQYARLFRS